MNGDGGAGARIVSELSVDELREAILGKPSTSQIAKLARGIGWGWKVILALVMVVGAIVGATRAWDALETKDRADDWRDGHMSTPHPGVEDMIERKEAEFRADAKREHDAIKEGVVEVQVQSIEAYERLEKMIEMAHPQTRNVQESDVLRRARAKAHRAKARGDLFKE